MSPGPVEFVAVYAGSPAYNPIVSQTDFLRYHRQTLLPFVGEDGQARLARARAVIVGCGALGGVVADLLARAGVGHLTLIDRDIVELTNLQRQGLFDERDVAGCAPKAEAARARLAQINSSIDVRAIADDLNWQNAERLMGFTTDTQGSAEAPDVIIDGTDNFETRYLLNDLAVKHSAPYVYAGVVSTHGMVAAFMPGATPCLRCVFPEAPAPGVSETCDTAGVLGPAVSVIAGLEATAALKVLLGQFDPANATLTRIDVWMQDVQHLSLADAKRGDCPCCGGRVFEHLEGGAGSQAAVLCGRGSVQVAPPGVNAEVDLESLARRLAPHGRFDRTPFMLRGVLRGERGDANELIELVVFPNGRAIVSGTQQIETARSIYARYVGS